MRNDGYVLEMRFLVPPHLADMARRAMAPFAVEERPAVGADPAGAAPGMRAAVAASDKCHLTGQELDLLLRG
ncbi:hypothetical protein [Fundidesulfovibrio terrae]|uniref:hypothetical protein n=1 Tax=Fundidesulfovibrio terrae TaxID=2922866 RepID=UPI001FAF4134|nr:hypothetical protein [Fundidesulfovibrio terrae]